METDLSTDVKYCNIIVTHFKVWHHAHRRKLSTAITFLRVNDVTNNGAVAAATGAAVDLSFSIVDPLFDMTDSPLQPLATQKSMSLE